MLFTGQLFFGGKILSQLLRGGGWSQRVFSANNRVFNVGDIMHLCINLETYDLVCWYTYALMNICMYVCLYAHMYACVHVCWMVARMCLCMDARIYIYVYICTYVCMHICWMYASMYAWMYAHMYAFMHVCWMYVCMYAHIRRVFNKFPDFFCIVI